MPTRAQPEADDDESNLSDQNRESRKHRLSLSLALGRRKKKK